MEREHDLDRGVRLGTYADQSPEVGVSVWCLNPDCGRSQTFAMADVMKRLEARGVKAREVGIRELPRYLTRPCPWCGGSEMESRPHFPGDRMGLGR